MPSISSKNIGGRLPDQKKKKVNTQAPLGATSGTGEKRREPLVLKVSFLT